MSKPKGTATFRVHTGGADYLDPLAEKLAELAILRVSELAALKPPTDKQRPLWDLVITADHGLCFLVAVKSYSSFRLKIEPKSIAILELEMNARVIREARRSPTPLVMFLFDGDRGHGRFLRLDRLPEPDPGAKAVVIAFPVENTITDDSIRALVAELAQERAVPVAG